MKRLKVINLAVSILVMGILSFVTANSASAAGSAALSIVPRKNYTIEPGKSVNDTLTIRNIDSDQPLNLTLRVVDFTYNDDGGTPKLLLADDAPQMTWSLKPFLKIPQNIEIPPNGSKTIDMSVNIPARHGAGSYYSAIVYSSGASDGGNVGLSASGVTLVFTSVPGQVKEDLRLEKFGAYVQPTEGGKASYKYITTMKPRQMAYTLKNNGNVVEAPSGTISLKNVFGHKIEINNVNPSGSLALIGQSRTYTACIELEEKDVEFNGSTTKSKMCDDPVLWPGYYGASLNLFYGQNGNKTQEIISSGGFWYLPWWFIFTALAIFTVVVLVAWRTVHNIRTRLYGPKVKKIRRRR
jgi:hypothetical protein